MVLLTELKGLFREQTMEEPGEDVYVSTSLLNLMESHSDVANLPLSPFQEATIDEKASSSRKRIRAKALENTHDEILKERERRGKINELYSTLRSMVPVPNLFPKATKARIVDETISYIAELEQELKRLQERKEVTEAEARRTVSLQTHRNSSIDVTVAGNVSFFGVRSVVMRRNLEMEQIFRVFEEHKADVLAASVTVEDRKLTLAITALVNGDGDGNTTEKIKGDLMILLF